MCRSSNSHLCWTIEGRSSTHKTRHLPSSTEKSCPLLPSLFQKWAEATILTSISLLANNSADDSNKNLRSCWTAKVMEKLVEQSNPLHLPSWNETTLKFQAVLLFTHITKNEQSSVLIFTLNCGTLDLLLLPELFTIRSLHLFHCPDIQKQHAWAEASAVHCKSHFFVTTFLFCCCLFLSRRWHLGDKKFGKLQSALSVRSNVTPAWSWESAPPISRNVLSRESVLSRLDLLKVVFR